MCLAMPCGHVALSAEQLLVTTDIGVDTWSSCNRGALPSQAAAEKLCPWSSGAVLSGASSCSVQPRGICTELNLCVWNWLVVLWWWICSGFSQKQAALEPAGQTWFCCSWLLPACLLGCTVPSSLWHVLQCCLHRLCVGCVRTDMVVTATDQQASQTLACCTVKFPPPCLMRQVCCQPVH